MAAAHPPLPQLAFGNEHARTSDDLDAFVTFQRAAMPAILRYEPLRSRRAFRHRAATDHLGDVRLVTSASTALSMAADDSAEATILVPFRGWSTSVVEGCEDRWHSGGTAMYLPGSARTGDSGVRAVLAVSLDPCPIEAIAQGMLGLRDEEPVDLGMQAARLIAIGESHSPAAAFATATSGTVQNLGVLPNDSASSATAVSGDGSVVVGHGNDAAGTFRAYRWTTASGTL